MSSVFISASRIYIKIHINSASKPEFLAIGLLLQTMTEIAVGWGHPRESQSTRDIQASKKNVLTEFDTEKRNGGSMRAKQVARFLGNRRSTWKGLAAGAAGGLAGAWVMNQFQSVWSAAAERFSANGLQTAQRETEVNENSEDAPMKVAGRISKTLLGKTLTLEQKKKASPVVHYAFGALAGGFYGAMAERLPQVKRAKGLPFGTALFVAADEIAVPAFGLSKSPAEYPLSSHLNAFASHLIYGAATEWSRRGVRRALRFL
jgi:Protein of unknown function (DUF1440)